MLHVAFVKVLNIFVSGVSFPDCAIEDAEVVFIIIIIIFIVLEERKKKENLWGWG